MASLPEEIIADILSRVPTKSVMRFRCVCKPWCRLTSESTFIQMHFNRFTKKQVEKGEGFNHLFLTSKPNTLIEGSLENVAFFLSQTHLYCVSEDKAVEIKNPLEPSFKETLVLGSCNGLICLITMSKLCLLNPVTRESKLLRLTEGTKVYASYGFGYNSVDDVYKLVQLVWRDDDNGGRYFEGNIYSLNDTSIALSQRIENVPFEEFDCKKSGILLNETLHWVGKDKYESYPRIVSFKLRENVFEEVPRPYDVKNRTKISIGVLGGQLCMLNKSRTSEIEIWVMKNYGEANSWTKLFAMEANVVPSVPISWSTCYQYTNLLNLRALYLSSNEEVLITNGRDVLLYDPLQKKARNLEIQGIPDWDNIENVRLTLRALLP